MEKLINNRVMQAGNYLLADGNWHWLIVSDLVRDGVATFREAKRGTTADIFVPLTGVYGYSSVIPRCESCDHE